MNPKKIVWGILCAFTFSLSTHTKTFKITIKSDPTEGDYKWAAMYDDTQEPAKRIIMEKLIESGPEWDKKKSVTLSIPDRILDQMEDPQIYFGISNTPPEYLNIESLDESTKIVSADAEKGQHMAGFLWVNIE